MLTRDGYLLVAARGLRMLSYGFLSVILALYLSAIGFSALQIGTLFTVALGGGAAATTVISLLADRWGRRTSLIVSSVLMATAGAALASSTHFPLLLVFAALGTLSPSGQEIGPFQSLEQAALSEASTEPGRAMPYAWYNLVGYLAVALGALVAGVAPTALQSAGWTPLAAQRTLVWAFAVIGLVLIGFYLPLSPSVEAPLRKAASWTPRPGLHRSLELCFACPRCSAWTPLPGGLLYKASSPSGSTSASACS